MKFHKHDHMNIGRIESFDENATETPIAFTENIDRSTLGELLPLTSPKKVKKPTPSFFEGILKPAIFDQILNASLLIATGLSTEKSAAEQLLEEVRGDSISRKYSNLNLT